ncbi:GTP 3',8-cyclase MoaA [Microbulbifer yueqingensis]|uniref:GTP 3',8-cyclase n=1 Tax=Microbulbifer yueqingensis TaxID=658219 RepID=A0A1G8XK60_9GAMM|nr:GTP 3',8-cyclase MoaA [Microbulbifer yueqingensis]SDJ90130.1 cyclic pyranopterin monophosphate synthase subunit MoaA [Microbulbifer yueqingensis]
MLQDSYGRRFYYLRLSVTDICNFRCNYCLPDGIGCGRSLEGENPLTVAEVDTVIRAFASLGTEKVRLTGGEPSLRRDLDSLIAAVNDCDGIRRVAITTNGYRLPSQIDGWHAAGLDQLNVSVDSLDPAQFRRITGHDRLDRALAGIDRALELGIQTKVNAVLLRQHNLAGFEQFLDWVRQTPVTLRFIELMRTGDNREFFASNHVSGTDIESRLVKDGWQQVVRARDAGPAREYFHPDYAGRVGLITPYSSDFCASCNRLRMSAQGKLHLCLFADAGFDLRREIAAGDAEALAQHIRELIGGKNAGHELQRGLTGATRNLAMLGG